MELWVLFVLWLYVPLENFHSYRGVTRASNFDLCSAIMTINLSIVGSLACHTYCETGHPFVMIVSKDS